MMEPIVTRFMEYTRFDTKSDDSSPACPSTKGQLIFGQYLVEELKSIGLEDASIDENGYVMATLPANTDRDIPVIGFIAHMDTSPDMSGANVNPKLLANYDGKDIVLSQEENVVLSPGDFPELLQYIGEDLVVTDGTTLLGADDKAGIAEIVTAAEYLIQHPDIKHGTVKVAFTPDEEIGRGADRFDAARFGAAFAYTVDGGAAGELEYENFNAAEAKIVVKGRNVHPGAAKNKMINSILIAMEFQAMLPPSEIPAHTEGYEGFFHLNSMSGNVEETAMTYIIRDHDQAKFARRKRHMENIVQYLNEKYQADIVRLRLRDQYYNMKEKIEPVFHTVEMAKEAIEAVGLVPKIKPIRGGTDGARLSYRGLPCPNIFTGGHNFHGKYEYIPVSSMKRAVDVILKIIELNSKA